MYLHVVERRDDGIIVRGAKAHQTGSLNAHAIIAMPTAALGRKTATTPSRSRCPANAGHSSTSSAARPTTRQAGARAGIDQGNPATAARRRWWSSTTSSCPGSGSSCAARRVRRPAGGTLRRRITARTTGAARRAWPTSSSAPPALRRVQRRRAGASHVRDKVVEMVHLAETLYCGIACSAEGSPAPPPASILVDLCWPTSQAQRHSLRLRDRSPGPGHRRRPHRDVALRAGPATPRLGPSSRST